MIGASASNDSNSDECNFLIFSVIILNEMALIFILINSRFYFFKILIVLKKGGILLSTLYDIINIKICDLL